MTEQKRKMVGRLGRIQLLHRMAIQRTAMRCGLYLGQPPILEYILCHDHCTQREVADHLQISPPSVATSVKRMQKAGLLLKEEDPDDLRYTRLTLTDKGKTLLQQCRQEFDRIDAQMFAGFSPEEYDTLAALLDRMLGNLTTDEVRGRSIFSLMEEEKQLQRHIQGGESV